ncbi:MAG: C10 family peptidase [Bacteroidales bacterium]|nr:C10 family peptidase [Bacteroidales bacterium]
MKNIAIFISVITCVFAVSCDKFIESDILHKEIISESSEYKVTINDVMLYANARFNRTKSNSINIEVFKRGNDSVAFLIECNNQWEILSGDKRTPPIIAKGTGFFDTLDINPNKKLWLDMTLCEILELKNNETKTQHDLIDDFWIKLNGPASSKAEGDPVEDNLHWELIEIIPIDAGETGYNHLLDTKWGQYAPWNQHVPYANDGSQRCAAGCVAISAAQMLHYLHYKIGKPASFFTSGYYYGTVDNGGSLFQNSSPEAWDNMALDIFDLSSSRRSQSALLISWSGINLGLDYGKNSSSGKTEKIVDYYDTFGILCSYESYNKEKVKSSILNGMPVIVRADKDLIIDIPAIIEISGGGHSWIIDGYLIGTDTYKYLYQWTSKTDNHLYEYGEIREEIVEESREFIKMNWGWDGYNDDTYYTPGGSWQVGNDTYQYSKKMIVDFR